MKLQTTDYNGAADLIQGPCAQEWEDLDAVLSALPLHLKASDQAGIQGKAIFDPIGTNSSIRSQLQGKRWTANIPIPQKYRFLGTDIDLGKNGVIVEVQFSNYPFLLNNTLRSELFYKAGTEIASRKTALLLIITKGRMFPASNSTLYYEQAKNQLDALAGNGVFTMPIRLIGLMAPIAENTPAVWTEYEEPRYSRTVVSRTEIRCDIRRGRSVDGRCTITRRDLPA